jgi:hypothetical protein
MKVFRKTKWLTSFEIKNNGKEQNLMGEVEDTYPPNNSVAYQLGTSFIIEDTSPTAVLLREDLRRTLVLLRKSGQTRTL